MSNLLGQQSGLGGLGGMNNSLGNFGAMGGNNSLGNLGALGGNLGGLGGSNLNLGGATMPLCSSSSLRSSKQVVARRKIQMAVIIRHLETNGALMT